MRKAKKVSKTKAKLKLHPAQSNIFLNQNTHRTMCCSRRFGKSVLLRAMVCDAAINFKGVYSPLFPSVVAIIMPTLKQARSIHWNPLVDMLREHPAVEKILKSDFRIVIKGNRPDIILRGCNEDNGDSLRGLKIYLAAFDEVQDVKETVWIDVVSPALADTQESKAVFCGCMNPETRVITDTGIRKIKEFDQGKSKGVLAPIDANIWGLNKKLSKADGFYNNGVQATLKLKTYHGYEIEGTYNHPVMTKEGWKPMEDLTDKDLVAIDYGMDVWGNEDISRDFELSPTEEFLTKKFAVDNSFSYILGHLIQRGFINTDSKGNVIGIYIKICQHDTELINVIKSKTIAGLRFKDSRTTDFRRYKLVLESQAVLEWLDYLGIDLSVAPKDRTLPEFLFKSNRNTIVQFLKGFSDAHGTFVKVRKVPIKKITITCPSETIGKEIQLLLTNLGIVPLRQFIKKNRTTYNASPFSSLTIRGDSFNKFKDTIGFSSASFDYELRHMRKQMEAHAFKLDSDYLWDKVIDLTQSACPTYDFTIPETQSYWANGIIVHNTPKGIGTFFHSLFLNGEKNPEEWSSFHQTCYDNPFLDLEKLETQKRNLPAKIFRQEFLATWESFDGQIFSDLNTENFIDDSELPSVYEELLLGVDWGDINPALVVCGYRDKTYYLLDFWLNPNPGYAIEQRHHDSAAIDFCIKYNISKSYADPSQPGRILSMRRAGVPKLVAGYNRIEEGNGILNTLFFQNRIRIRKDCKAAYDILISYHRDKKDGVILDRVAPGQDDHLCFAKGTSVLSITGEKEISKVKPGDILWNGESWDTVEVTSERMAETIEIKDEEGNKLRCTPDHPFEAVDSELIRASALSYNKGIKYLNEDQCKKLLNTKETPIIMMVKDTMFSIKGEETHQERFDYTGEFGKNITVRYLKDATYTIKTITNSIMSYPIWNVYLLKNTLDIIMVESSKARIKLKNGTHPKKEVNGTPTIGKTQLVNILEKQLPLTVNSAEKSLKLLTSLAQDISSAPTTAKVNTEDSQELIMRKELVQNAVQSLPKTSTVKQGLALESVQQNRQQELVYSIKMKEVSRYFVKVGTNFVKTSNCDSLRYLISTREHKTFNKEVYGALLVPQKTIQLPKQVGGLYQNGVF